MATTADTTSHRRAAELVADAISAVVEYDTGWLRKHQDGIDPVILQRLLELRALNFDLALAAPDQVWSSIREFVSVTDYVRDCTTYWMARVAPTSHELKSLLIPTLAFAYGWTAGSSVVDEVVRSRSVDASTLTQLMTTDPWVVTLLLLALAQ